MAKIKNIEKWILALLILIVIGVVGFETYFMFIGGKILWASEFILMSEWGVQNVWPNLLNLLALFWSLIYILRGGGGE